MSPRSAQAVAGAAGDPAAALREHLIDAAGLLLSQREVAAITTRDLARAAQVSDGVLYNYFADKNELLLTALVRRFTGLVERLLEALPDPGTGTVDANLQVVARALYDLHADAFPIVGSLLAEPALLHRFMAAIHSAEAPFGGKQIRDLVVAYVLAEQHGGRLASVDAVATADLLIGATATLVLTGRLVGPAFEPGDRLAAIVKTLVRGLEPQPQRSSR
jgi:AcrR family transcriptional regulator